MTRGRLVYRMLVVSALILFGLSTSNVLPAAGADGLPRGPVAPAGFVMLTEQQVSTPLPSNDPDRYNPQAAYDSSNGRFLVVWHQTYASGHDREVYGQLVTAAGAKYGAPIVISSGSHDRTQPAVAYSKTSHEYLVVFMYDVNGDGKKYDILGQRISESGALVAPAFTVITWANRTFWAPRITWNSMWDEFMIVWGAAAQDTQTPTDIGMKCFGPTGDELWAWIVTSAGFPSAPDITYDIGNDRYLVVWNYVNASGKSAIAGDLRDSEGDHKQSVNIFASDTNDAILPHVAASMGLFYLVTFEVVNSSTDHDIDIAWIGKDGGFLYSTGLVTGATNDTHASIAGSMLRFEYMITYQRADVAGAKIYMLPVSNLLPLTSLEVCNYVFTDCSLPSVAIGGATFLNAYIIDTPDSFGGSGRLQPQATVPHVFDRPFNTAAIYLPAVTK